MMVLVQFVMMMAFSSMSPFIAPFIEELGIHDPQEVKIWAGTITAISALFAAIFSPIWGSLSDRYGRKIMVVRSCLAVGICTLLTSMVVNIYQILSLRILMGIFSGFSATAITLVVSNTPKDQLGYALGWLQVGQVMGLVLGPTLGGFVADWTGYRSVFILTGAISLGAAALTIMAVHDDFDRRQAGQEGKQSRRNAPWKIATAIPAILVMFIVLLLAQFSIRSVEPILSLYVAELGAPPAQLNTLTGLVFAVTGLAQAGGLLVISRYSSLLGYRKLLLITLVGSGLLYLPQSFVSSAWQLIILRAFFGFFLGGILPMANSIIGEQAPLESRGSVYGFTSSATFLGNFSGPLIGGVVAAYWGIRTVFLVTGVLLLLNSLLVWQKVPRQPARPQQEASHGTAF